MHIHNLSTTNSILNSFISEIRDVTIQKDKMRFRRNIERIGEVLAYEMSKAFDFNPKTITTPLGNHNTEHHANNIVLCSILRAGIPLHNGLLQMAMPPMEAQPIYGGQAGLLPKSMLLTLVLQFLQQ